MEDNESSFLWSPLGVRDALIQNGASEHTHIHVFSTEKRREDQGDIEKLQ